MIKHSRSIRPDKVTMLCHLAMRVVTLSCEAITCISVAMSINARSFAKFRAQRLGNPSGNQPQGYFAQMLAAIRPYPHISLQQLGILVALCNEKYIDQIQLKVVIKFEFVLISCLKSF